MQYSKLAGRLREKINKFSGYVSTNLDKTARHFVEALYGIMSSLNTQAINKKRQKRP